MAFERSPALKRLAGLMTPYLQTGEAKAIRRNATRWNSE
jgi:hypothetical protein